MIKYKIKTILFTDENEEQFPSYLSKIQGKNFFFYYIFNSQSNKKYQRYKKKKNDSFKSEHFSDKLVSIFNCSF